MTIPRRDYHFPDVTEFSIDELNEAYKFYESEARKGSPPTNSTPFCVQFKCSQERGKMLLASSEFRYRMTQKGLA